VCTLLDLQLDGTDRTIRLEPNSIYIILYPDLSCANNATYMINQHGSIINSVNKCNFQACLSNKSSMVKLIQIAWEEETFSSLVMW